MTPATPATPRGLPVWQWVLAAVLWGLVLIVVATALRTGDRVMMFAAIAAVAAIPITALRRERIRTVVVDRLARGMVWLANELDR